MEARELRIGNFVNVRYGDNPHEVQSVGLNGIDLRAEDGYSVGAMHENDELSGIPLTEEWLLKFGFFEKNLNFYLDGIELYFQRAMRIYVFKYFENKTNGRYIEIEYVHQLQNLYFALTGSELTIKETVSNEFN